MLVPGLLTAEHDVSTFCSGEASLDQWLRHHALAAQQRGLSRVFVLHDDDDPGRRVVAYYTLTAHVLERDDLTRRLGRGLPSQLPAVLLGKLAVDESRQGAGLGGMVLAEAVGRVAHVADQVGVRFLVVDALNERAATFYERYGFQRVPDRESTRLLLRITPDLLTC